eukprot:8457659-Alexandrium_andersonii.AAC.1
MHADATRVSLHCRSIDRPCDFVSCPGQSAAYVTSFGVRFTAVLCKRILVEAQARISADTHRNTSTVAER